MNCHQRTNITNKSEQENCSVLCRKLTGSLKANYDSEILVNAKRQNSQGLCFTVIYELTVSYIFTSEPNTVFIVSEGYVQRRDIFIEGYTDKKVVVDKSTVIVPSKQNLQLILHIRVFCCIILSSVRSLFSVGFFYLNFFCLIFLLNFCIRADA